MPKRFAVVGNPIKHSLSPQIHQAFAAQFGISLTYDKLLAEPETLAQTIESFWGSDGVGLNITLPFKEQIMTLAEVISADASAAGAANTLWRENGKVYAHNTDGVGLIEDLNRSFGNLSGARVLLIGAGGAAKGAVPALLNAQVGHLYIHNRTMEKAEALVDSHHSSRLSALSDISSLPAIDLIINTSSAGLVAGSDTSIYKKAAVLKPLAAYDMQYQQQFTPFLAKLREHDPRIKLANGLGMLVGQAAQSFNVWHKQLPEVEPVLTQLGENLYAKVYK